MYNDIPNTAEVGVLLALADVKGKHGKARREAMRELDALVTKHYPPVEGTPLPSEELNGMADVCPGLSCVDSISPTFFCKPVELGRVIPVNGPNNPYSVCPPRSITIADRLPSYSALCKKYLL